MNIIRILCVFLMPPLAVFLTVGIGVHFWINLVLTIFTLGILGIVHAVWVIARRA